MSGGGPANGGAPEGAGPVALALRGVALAPAGVPVLSGVSAEFRCGSLTAIVGRRGSGRSLLAALLAGQRVPDRGAVARTGPPAPLVGVASGFGATGSVARDLAFRAAAWGIDGRDYLRAVEAVTGRPDLSARPFRALDGAGRSLLLFASAYLLPAGAYVADGPPLPGEPGIRARLEPLLRRARRDAAVIWLTRSPIHLRGLAPDRLLLLDRGRLSPLADLAAAVAHLAERPDAAVAEAEEPEEIRAS